VGNEDGPLFRAYYDVTEAGNASTGSVHGFEHKNILHVDYSLEEVATHLSVPPERLSEAVEHGKRILFEAREKRVKPGRDEKVLTAWNGLMLASMAEAGAFLGGTVTVTVRFTRPTATSIAANCRRWLPDTHRRCTRFRRLSDMRRWHKPSPTLRFAFRFHRRPGSELDRSAGSEASAQCIKPQPAPASDETVSMC
jgi:uncharacterized protein YyaL (SSP411 family)